MSAFTSDIPPRWYTELQGSVPSIPKGRPNILDPPGYTSGVPAKRPTSNKDKKDAITPSTPADLDELKIKKAWEIANSPSKQLPMTAIMMYMSGNSLQIFSIMMVLMAFQSPIKSLVAIKSTFERFENENTKGSILTAKFIYVLWQIAALGLGIWKVNGMGLLPTTRSDWLAWEAARTPLETAIPAY